MTMTLTYMSDLSRVRIALSALTDGLVRVERSTNELFWQTVRGGVDLPVSAGSAVLDDYEFADGVQNFYRVVPADPPAGMRLTAVGDYASTPDAVALDIAGDIDLRADVTLEEWETGGENQYFVSKYNTTGQRAYALRLNPSNNLEFAWSTTGSDTPNKAATATLEPDPDTGRLAVRGTLDVDDGGDHTVRLYTAPTIEGPWSQLGSSRTSDGTTSIFNSTAPLEVGRLNGGATTIGPGTVHAVEVRDGIDGTAVANPDFAAQPSGTLNFVDAAGRTWTLQGGASIVGTPIETGSITPSLAGVAWLKSVRYPMLNQTIRVSEFTEITRPARTGMFPVSGRSVPVTVTDIRGVRAYILDLYTSSSEEHRKLELALMASDVVFLHVPVDGCFSKLPGSMYAVVGDLTKDRVGKPASPQLFRLPLTEAAPPAPNIVSTTLTWGTVANLYGSWNALIGANPTWGDLLATVGSGEDLVVI